MKINNFNQKIYSILKKVPKGRITTYKILAKALGTKAYRAVGQAMRYNLHAPKVPCHRVVSSNGKIGGFSGTMNPESREVKIKITMLRKEGIKIENNRIKKFEKVLVKRL